MISGRKLGFTARPVGGCFQAPTTNRSKPCETRNPSSSSFTVYARSIEQARAIVAAKVAGETIVLPVSLDGASQ
jgi:hypothetical protein